MAEPFTGIKAKLDRSVGIIREISEERRQFLASDEFYGITIDYESEPGYLLVKVLELSKPPPIFSVLIGELLYHCRSCLDHLACELTELNSGIVDTGVAFPIFDDPDKFRINGRLTKSIRKRIGGIDPTKQAIIEREQPFARYQSNPHDDPLWHLYELSDFDRHQALNVVGTFVAGGGDITFDPPPMGTRFALVNAFYGTLEGETEIARYEVLSGPAADVKVNANVPLDVAFSKSGPGGGRPVLKCLSALGLRMADLINVLAR